MSEPNWREDPGAWLLYWFHWIMATFGMGWKTALDYWTKVDPKTGRTPYQTTQYLQEYESHEKMAQEKSSSEIQTRWKAQKSKQSEPSSTIEERNIRKIEYVEAEQKKFSELDEIEQQVYLREQDEIEAEQRFQDNQKMLRAEQIKTRDRTSTQPAPKPEPVDPIVTTKPATDTSAYDQYSIRKRSYEVR